MTIVGMGQRTRIALYGKRAQTAEPRYLPFECEVLLDMALAGLFMVV